MGPPAKRWNAARGQNMSLPANLNSQVIRNAFASPESFATTLLTLFIELYGTEGFQWDPETIRMELSDDLRVKIPQPNFDRLMTGINLITSDDFFRSLPDFITYCNILSGDTYDPRTWDPADAAEIAWGLTEALLIQPPEDDDENPFSEEIVAYIGQALDQEGIINPPDILKIAVRANDPARMVAGEYSDDPEMFNSIYDFEHGKTEDINNIVRDMLRRLTRQLESLPLRSGNTAGAVQQMLQSLDNKSSTSL